MRQKQALGVMLSGASVFLTGPPGAGKTYVLNDFVTHSVRRGKKVAVTASTGIAATHIGGSTIHSWTGLGIRDQLLPHDVEWLQANDRLRKRYVSTDILVIDEVSMLHGARLDMINQACKLLRENDLPFGGLQVILVGDLFQLPPVNRESELVDFAHTSGAWEELNPKICYLSEQHRQQGDQLLDVLEAMRRGEVEEWHTEALMERLGKKPSASAAITRLYAHNVDVDTINYRHLSDLDGDTKSFEMEKKGSAAKVEQLVRSVLAPEMLELKKSAEVMFVANNFAEGFVNGSRGRVIGFQDGMPMVRLLSNGRTIYVEPHSWTLTDDGKKRAEVIQLPLRLAWAITIHKSQGMSLDGAEIDLSKSFTPGMGYVALSRVRTLDGLYLTGINAMAMRLHPDIFEFDSELQNASQLLAADTPDFTEAEVTVQEPSEKYDETLFAKLKSWRTKRAQAERMPPYIIAHDKALEALSTNPPATKAQLLAINGFGPAKVEKYGDDILEITRENATEAATSEAVARNSGEWSKSDEDSLRALLKDHTSLAEVCSKLSRDPEDVWAHIANLL